MQDAKIEKYKSIDNINIFYIRMNIEDFGCSMFCCKPKKFN